MGVLLLFLGAVPVFVEVPPGQGHTHPRRNGQKPKEGPRPDGVVQHGGHEHTHLGRTGGTQRSFKSQI